MNIRQFVENNGLQIKSETEDELHCICPWHEDRNPSMSINKSTGKWICFKGCGAGTFKSFVKKLTGKDILDQDLLKKILQSKISSLLNERKSELPSIQFPKYKRFSDLIREGIEKESLPYINYILGRLKWETIKKFKLGYCDEGRFKNRIIIPIIENGEEISFSARSILNELPPGEDRYKFPYGFRTKEYVFNIDNVDGTSPVIIYESIMDLMTSYQLGLRNCVSLFSANISSQQISKILDRGISEIILCLHNDEAGNKSIEKRKTLLRSVFKSVKKIVLPPNEDVNEIGEKFIKYYCTMEKI